VQLCLSVAHVKKQEVKQLKLNLNALYNTISEGVIMLEPTETPAEESYAANHELIKVNSVGVTHYKLVGCNK